MSSAPITAAKAAAAAAVATNNKDQTTSTKTRLIEDESRTDKQQIRKQWRGLDEKIATPTISEEDTRGHGLGNESVIEPGIIVERPKDQEPKNDQHESEPLLDREEVASKHQKNNKDRMVSAARTNDARIDEHIEVERKWSQASSQASSMLGGSRRSSSISAGLDQKQPSDGSTRKFLMDKLARKSSSIVNCFHLDQLSLNQYQKQEQESSSSLDDPKKHPQEAKISRTISQSMLELDESCIKPSDKFEIVWNDLDFAYEPRSWLARAGSRIGSSLGLTDQRTNSNLVLKSVSGGFKSNQLVAIIGPSGCGKTTLLQFLAGNNCAQRDKLRINGLEEPKVAYIGQDDALLPGLTARETLMYASRLQNSRKGFDHAQHIQPILNELGLLECAERSVAKLSGGQAKRVTIAQELLYPTNLLILDEVTSGLDASTSYSIVKLLKYLVSDNRYPMSIVMSIHQPSARLFAVFDQVYVMSDGCCLYEGSCELAQINDHLAKFDLACPHYHNIADYLIELACCAVHDDDNQTRPPYPPTRPSCDGNTTTTKQSNGAFKRIESPTQASHSTRDRMVEYQRKLQESSCRNFYDDTKSQHQPLDTTTSTSLYVAIERARARRPRPFYDHFRIHLKRSLLRIRRSYILTYLQLITYIVLGLQLATFYGNDIGRLSGCPRLPANLMSYVLSSGNKSDQDADEDLSLEVRRIQENMNFLLVTVMTATFAALEITVITFPLEAKTVKREWRNGWYRVSSYFFGRTLADLPFQLVFVMIFCLLVYVLTGQIGLLTWRFPAFVATIVMTALVAQSFGFIFGAMFMDNLPAAVFTAPLAIFPTLLFSGFFSRVSQIPGFYRPMTYLSHFRYAFDALLVALYGYDRCNCDQTTLDQYHASMHNQTSSMREMFSYLFGASDCAPPTATTTPAWSSDTPPDEYLATSVSHDDLAAIQSSNTTLADQLIQSVFHNAPNATSMSPPTVSIPQSPASFMKPLEDALIEGAFEQMSRNDTTMDEMGGGGGAGDMSVMDRLASRFSIRLTTLLNKQSNFGHQMPTECRQFNSYLLTEFDLHDEDLIFGLLMLFLVVILTRVLCNCLLNFTIATRMK